MSAMRALALGICVFALACGGGTKAKGGDSSNDKMSDMDKKMMTSMKKGGGDKFGPLEYGADWKTYTKVNKQPFFSKPHGKRMVEIYVNKIGLEAYTSEKPSPVGTIIVKPSWDIGKDGKPSTKAGPTFVMVKKEKGFDKDNNDWWYAIHWENPPAPFNKNGGLYWRSPSKRVDYCGGCHENYDNEVGLPPRAQRTWKEKSDDASDSKTDDESKDDAK